ncbi:MAG: MogA/MoaB family molybdenum cofactor biosynthesis protein, partial [Microcystaceae cyanobacterium]
MLPHPDSQLYFVNYAVLTISDTRTSESDSSGQLIQTLLNQKGYHLESYQILPDEPQLIQTHLEKLGLSPSLKVILCNGGTGISPRDNTYEVIEKLLTKILPGFGELFRFLSYQEIGSRAIASRAVAGIYQNKLLFSLPGSTNAVQLAMEKLILPEL